MDVERIFGLIGDILTFGGSILLILNEIDRAKEFKKIDAGAKALKELADIDFRSEDGNRLASLMDLVAEALKNEGNRARIGFTVICTGFCCQLISRLAGIKWS